MKTERFRKCSNMELIRIIKTSKPLKERSEAQHELDARNLDPKMIQELENRYHKALHHTQNRKTQSLTFEEKFLMFVIPFFTPRPRWRQDHFSVSELERFRKHGFDKKLKQAQMIRVLGVIFWLSLFFIAIYFVQPN